MRWQESALAILFVLPALLMVCLFLYYPIGQTLIFSLYDLRFTTELTSERFIGLGNYQAVWDNSAFWRSLRFTLYFVAMSISLEFVIGMAMAMATFFVAKPLRALLRVIIIIPWAIPPIIHAALFRWLFNSDVGLFGQILVNLGIVSEPPLFLFEPVLAANSVVFAYVWKSSAITSIFFMSGLAIIPDSLHEAAQVDGARSWMRFRYITLPLLVPTIITTLLFRTIDAFRAFDIVYGLTQGTGGTEVLSYFAYQFYFRFNQFGAGSAYALVTFVLVMTLSFFYIRRVMTYLQLRGHTP
ncbi:MAG: carbohydrate ABC transporter permease [Anaerolineae bacterium]